MPQKSGKRTRVMYKDVHMINPLIDIAFKKIFGVETNSDILISLLNSIVSEEDQISEIEILNPYNERNFKKDKLSILDVKARNKHTGTYFLVEMQLADELDYHKRGLYGWARVYSNQIGASVKYRDLKRTIAIHILNFTAIDYEKEKGWSVYAPNKYHHRFVLLDKDTHVGGFKDIEIHTIELSKYGEEESEDIDEVLSKAKEMLDKWLAVLTKYALMDPERLPKGLWVPEMKKALRVMKEMQMNEIEREVYESHLAFLRFEDSAFEKRYYDGVEEGKAIGTEKGRTEERLSIARNLLSLGVDVKKVREATGLSEGEVDVLLEKGS
ncbi:Rpn family recombination-promoting nuclease/putative transposase [Rickettsiales endosymbiont of Peranema trichophorum]|uniref:Rpn family recombination-promoting nuclease/putative transposase n=1 Tax=Rickettsiales endosymbiont of Peranema trichophorum TaxID=2486577 RepID=UPI001022EF6C|nr:Rpn family recombination-promoting nuclease/putative transposase [Rickettsiales endosymbiont of Peranema trichophorum]RZI46014.1 Rpn family recombination-promoting nuclease/putative transposase [Rickettsiales endosymbiont of Peranema trichophorum]